MKLALVLVLALAAAVAMASQSPGQFPFNLACDDATIRESLLIDGFSVFENQQNGFFALVHVQVNAGADPDVVSLTTPFSPLSYTYEANPSPSPRVATHNFVAATFGDGSESTILGGNRDTIVYIDQDRSPSLGNGARLRLGDGNAASSLSVDSGIFGTFEIQWDGVDSNDTPQGIRNFNTVGLGGIDLTFGGTIDAIPFIIEESDSLDTLFYIEAWGMDGTAVGLQIPSSGIDNSRLDFTFGSFVVLNGGSSSVSQVFQNLGALRLVVTWNEVDNPEFDLDFFSLGVANRYCMVKGAVAGTADDTSGRIALFEGLDYFGVNCANNVGINEKFTYVIQGYIQGPDTSTFVISDSVSSDLIVDRNSIEIYRHGIPATEFVAVVDESTANNEISVTLSFPGVNTVAFVSIFFEASHSGSNLDLLSCRGQVSNRATLSLNGAEVLQSSDFVRRTDTVVDIVERSTNACIFVFSIDNALALTTTTANVAQIDFGETFSVTSNYANTGIVDTENVRWTISTSEGVSPSFGQGLTSLGNGEYSANIGTVSQGSTGGATIDFEVANDAPATVSITFCIATSGLPDRCAQSSCQTVSLNTGGVPNVKIMKRGYMVRKLVYDIDFWNKGDAAALDVVVTENIPAGTTFNADESDPGWRCANDDCTTLVYERDSLAAFAADCANLCLFINEDTAPCTKFSNSVTIAASNDVDASNNFDSIDIYEPGCDA